MRERQLSLNDRVEEIDERLDEIRQKDEKLRREFDPEDDDKEVTETEEWQELDGEFRSLKAKKQTFERYLDEWGGGGFKVKELTFGETMRARDQVNQASFSMNSEGTVDGVPRDGFYRIKVVELGLVDVPAGAPDEAEDLPYEIGSWLYDEIDELTTHGGADLENLSLRAESGTSPPN